MKNIEKLFLLTKIFCVEILELQVVTTLKIETFTNSLTYTSRVSRNHIHGIFNCIVVVHVHNYPNVKTRHDDIDFVIVRDNLEGEYSGIEHEVYPGVFESLKIITREKAIKIASYAFEYAYLTGRKKVTCVHKANIMYFKIPTSKSYQY